MAVFLTSYPPPLEILLLFPRNKKHLVNKAKQTALSVSHMVMHKKLQANKQKTKCINLQTRGKSTETPPAWSTPDKYLD